ncbi:DUF1415 domain-containing protein [Alteromonas sp. ASW11-19]|uniref:DUF1415 domain-containing protein n=1 Tax=Alteromonas salexigens TaxID=2982530 RepID=A0ABT2VV20_9ALTE|nr:DUF1415 domain-containing protein [Alteromonas salexigens]MCU7555704.1 DUF1415 domain-containing protein [Alteromonas salexigens]
MSDHPVITATRKWVDDVVIAHNFCPFARFVRQPDRIRYRVSKGTAGDILEDLFQECRMLDSDPEVATTLIILDSESTASFAGYLDILGMGERLLEEWGYRGVYQLASFHPDYLFDGEPEDAASHFTNRSPHPVLHLIREDDIEKALASYGAPEQIYEDNMEVTEEKGQAYFKTLLKQCKHAQRD